MKISQLIKNQDRFHEDSHKILLYQSLQVLYYFSMSPLSRGIQEKSQMKINQLIKYHGNFREDSDKILLYQ